MGAVEVFWMWEYLGRSTGFLWRGHSNAYSGFEKIGGQLTFSFDEMWGPFYRESIGDFFMGLGQQSAILWNEGFQGVLGHKPPFYRGNFVWRRSPTFRLEEYWRPMHYVFLWNYDSGASLYAN